MFTDLLFALNHENISTLELLSFLENIWNFLIQIVLPGQSVL